MPYKELSAGSAHVKKIRGLAQAKQRARFEQQLVEGVQAVRELVVCTPELVRDVYVTRAALEGHRDIEHSVVAQDMFVHIAAPKLMAHLAPSAQGICAIADFSPSSNVDQILAHDPQLLVCCVQANDPGNVGTIIRTADACGAGAVFLGDGSVDPHSPKVIRSAAGSTFHLPVCEHNVDDLIARVKRAGFQVLLADADGDVNLTDLQQNAAPNGATLATPTLWMVGNEAHGFSAQHKSYADHIVAIPMWGRAESLNLAVATGVCLYASAAALY